jgi:hypothetical protein
MSKLWGLKISIEMTKRRISSRLTILCKFIAPILWVSIMSIGSVLALFRVAEEPGSLIIIFVGIISSFFIIRFALRLKLVSIDDAFLYVSDYRKEIQIPFSQIESVAENFLTKPKLILLKLISPSEFGGKIVFIPPLQLFGAWRSHPMVSELKHISTAHRRI